MITQNEPELIDKIKREDGFSASWDAENDKMLIYYQFLQFSIFNDWIVLPRGWADDIKIKSLFNIGLPFVSGELYNRNPLRVFHKHYYYLIDVVSERGVSVIVKYFGRPFDIYNNGNAIPWLLLAKNAVKKDSVLTIVDKPFGHETHDISIGIDKMDIKPNTGHSFYFAFDLFAHNCYDIQKSVDIIIQDIEKQINI